MTAAPRWAQDPRLLWRATATRVVARRIDDEQFLVLEGSAAQLWVLLEQGRTAGEVAEDLGRLYGVPAEQLRPDVDAGIADLVAARLAAAVAA